MPKTRAKTFPPAHRAAANQPASRPLVPLLLAASSGGLTVLAFPKFNLLPLATVALLPLLTASAKESSAGRRFLGGLVAGGIFFAGTCYWIYTVQRQYGGLGPPSAAGIFALFVVALALFWGLFAWIAGYLWRVGWGPAAVPALWVALEYARTYAFTGFPWLLAGYAFTDYFALARIARWTGVYGLSYLVLAIPVACLWLVLRPGRGATAYLLALAALMLTLVLMPSTEHYNENQTAYLVQPNIPQEVAFEPWEEKTQSPLLARLKELTINAVGRPPEPAFIIWPEVPAPFYFFEDSFTAGYARAIANSTHSYFEMGIVRYLDNNRDKPMNSSVLLDPNGVVVSRYDKIHLVPFGEYVPLRRWLVLAEKVTAEIGDFVPGMRVVVASIRGGRVATFICYEAIFPDLVRRFAKEGAEVLVNISNDGWYGSSAARYQHLLMARMRAIENARYLLRATNTGITAVIRPDGRIAGEIPPDHAGVLKARWAYEGTRTFYTRFGDIFAIAMCLFAAAALVAGAFEKGPI